MAWTNIDNSLVSVGALPFATTIQALRDNPIAIANGDAGAPKVQNAALATINATVLATDAAMINWVLARTAGASVGAVGTYANLLYVVNVTTQDTLGEGSTVAGSSLRYTGSNPASIGSAPAGTWRCMGRTRTVQAGGGRVPITYTYYGTVFLRIS